MASRWIGDICYKVNMSDINQLVIPIFTSPSRKIVSYNYSKNYPEESPHIMDIGAAVGYYSILVRHRFPEAEIHAIDALELHCNALTETFALNGLSLDGVVVHKSALADRERTVLFLDQTYGSQILSAEQADLSCGQITPVHAHRLATYIARAGGQVDLAKMDIQGSEAVVLESSNTVLREGHVRSWIVGTHSSDQHERCLECLSPHYIIRFEDQKPSFQPDGIIVAVHKTVA